MNTKSIIFFIMILYPFILNSKTLKGTVSEKGTSNNTFIPIVGANVYWANTQTGTVTDINGKFELEKHQETNKLVLSYIGYKVDTIEIIDFNKEYKFVLSGNKELNEIEISERAIGSQMSKLNPVHTQNLGGAELKKAACCNLSESFETNAAVDVAYSDAVTGAKQIQMLGLSGKYVQLMTENYPNFTGLARSYGLSYIPVPWMQAISISKGTASVVNGYDAISGQINVEFLKPHHHDSKPFFINIFANDAAMFETNIYSTHILNDKWSSMLLFHSGNSYLKHDNNNDGFLDMPLGEQYHLFNRWDYVNGKGLNWHTGVRFLYDDKLSGQTNFDENKPRTIQNGFGIGINTIRTEAFSKLGYVFPKAISQSLALITNYSYHKQESFYGLKAYNASQNSMYANLIFQSDIKNPTKSITSGFDFRNDYYKEDLFLKDSANKTNRNVIGVGAYTEFTLHHGGWLTLLSGLRADYHTQTDVFITPRLHSKFAINDNLYLRTSVGKGYRFPNVIAENSYLLASSRHIIIDSDLKKEDAWNYGASVTKYFNFGKKKITLVVDYFRTDFKNQIVVDLDSDASQVHFYNLDGKSYSNNYQAEISATPFRGMEATFAYRYSDVNTTYNGSVLSRPLTSKYKGLVALSYQTPLKKWQFDITYQLNGDGRIPSTTTNPEAFQLADTFDPYSITNIQITKMFRRWEMYVGAENIFDFVQNNPIIAANDPFGSHFDATMIWGPVEGRKMYAGIRFSIDKD